MKKITALLLAAVCILSLAGCRYRGPMIDYLPVEPEESDSAAEDGITDETAGETDTAADDGADMIYDRIPMVRVDGKLYLDMGRKSTVTGRCGMMDGTIESQVPGSEIPMEDDQSNFGTGYGYQYGPEEGTVELCIDGEWYVYATEEKRQELQFGKSE